jgi:hypothetical protein
LAIWKAILAWALHKKEDGKEQECEWDGGEALKILRDIENRAKDACVRGWYFTLDLKVIEQSTTTAIEGAYNLLCQHPKFHADGDARMPCCIRKQLFKKMIEELPILPPVRKRSEWLFEN